MDRMNLDKKVESPEQDLSRKEFFSTWLEAGIFGGLVALCGARIAIDATRPVLTVAMDDLMANPERYFGRQIETKATLVPAGASKAQVLVALSFGLEKFASSATLDREYDLFSVGADDGKRFLVASRSHEQAKELNRPGEVLVLRGHLERAFINDRPVVCFELTLRPVNTTT